MTTHPVATLADRYAEAIRQRDEALARIAAVAALHTPEQGVQIDTIHRGLTPVYGEGCAECGSHGGPWPCDTFKALTGGTP